MGARFSLERGTAEELRHEEVQGDFQEPDDAGPASAATATLISSPTPTVTH